MRSLTTRKCIFNAVATTLYTSAAVRLERCIADVGQGMLSANRLKLYTDKTELLWVGTRYSLSQRGSFLVLQLDPDSIITSGHVRLL